MDPLEYLRPESWDDAVALKTEFPGALPLAGGTDVMVEVNFGRHRPGTLLDLSHLASLKTWSVDNGSIDIGAGVTYTRVLEELSGRVPALAIASRTVGSPQIRNKGTIAGNLATASPAGDAHPPLLATGAEVQVESMRGQRSISIEDFFTGVKRNALESDELIKSVAVPVAAGPQQFSKVGTRNAMVIAVVSFALALDIRRRRVGTGIGSAAPTPIRAEAAEGFLTGELDAGGYWETRRDLDAEVREQFGALVRAAANPIDDVRGTSAYRTHALGVLAARAVQWVWTDYQVGGHDAG